MGNNRAVCYLRVSTTEQSKHGVSLDMQEAKVRAYCELMGLEVVYIARDEGISASKALNTRPEGKRMIDIIKREDIGHVIALKLDRLFRSTIDCLNQTKEWDGAGVALHLIDMGGQAVDTSSAVGRLFLTMAAGFAELERALISERTASSLQHKKAQKKVYTNTPFGWDLVGKDLIVNPNEQNVIGRMVAMREDGASYHKIAKFLNEEEIPTKLGASWYAPSVRYILMNTDLHQYEPSL